MVAWWLSADRMRVPDAFEKKENAAEFRVNSFFVL